MPLSIAIDVCQVLVETGRAIPPPLWVAELIESRKREEYQKMAHAMTGL